MLHNEGKRKRPKPTSSAKQRAGKAETIPVEQKQEMKAKRKIFCFFVDIETRRPLYDELHFQNRTIDFWLDNEIGNWKYFRNWNWISFGNRTPNVHFSGMQNTADRGRPNRRVTDFELLDNFFISRVSAIACLSAASEPIHHLGKQLDLVCVNDPARIMRRQAALPVIRYSHEVSPSPPLATLWRPINKKPNHRCQRHSIKGRGCWTLFLLTKLDSISHEIQSIAPSFDDVFLTLQL